MTQDSIIDLWPALDELRKISRLVLVALEENELDRVQELAMRSRELATVIEEGLVDHPRSAELEAILRELRGMNDRILEVLVEQREEAAQSIAETRRQRFKVLASKRDAAEDAGFVNRVR